MIILNSFVRNILRIWYTVCAIFVLMYGYLRYGSKVLTRKPREKPKVFDEWKSCFAKMKEIRLHYVQKGDDDKPLLLFIHGFPEFWYSWRYQLEEFHDKYRCVAIDQRGYNLSDKPILKEHYTIDYLVKDIKDFIEHLGYEKAVICGHDWGGIVSWMFAEMHPEMVDKLIIMNAPRPNAFLNRIGSSLTQFFKSWYIFFFQTENIPEIFSMSNDMRLIDLCFKGKSRNISEEEIEIWKYVFSTNGGSFRYPIHYYRNIFENGFKESGRNILQMPILIIWGAEDTALDAQLAEDSLKATANARLEMIHGASHWVQQDDPHNVNRLMREFI